MAKKKSPQKSTPKKKATPTAKASKKKTVKKKTVKKKTANKKTSKPNPSSRKTGNKKTVKKKTKPSTKIHVLTDGTGGLPRHFLTSVLSQFTDLTEQPNYHVFCTTPEKTQSAFAKYVRKNSIVIHSFSESENKTTLEKLATEKGIPCFDLTGQAVAFLAEHTGSQPVEDQDLIHSHDQHYFDRIDAWEYTMQHDDSRRLDSIDKADIILLGLSRVSKTPTSAYLGWLGYRVANVSFAPECGIPQEVKKHRKKVIALTIQPKQLSEIRGRRMQTNGFADVIAHDPDVNIEYAGLRHVIHEVMDAEQIYRKLKVPMIDVTDSTVEETAARVLQIVE
jgi:regulator of PEP synthase PpsR (kinase-PPPase family)